MPTSRSRHAALAGLALAAFATVPAAGAADRLPHAARAAQTLERRAVVDADQAVAVDAEHFYAIDDRAIAKHEKATGRQVARWEGPKDGPIIHLDSGVVVDGRLYAAHSNYPQDPMTSSVEVWDVATMEHVDSHSLGIQLGSLTWLDRAPDGAWWGTFANYNRVFGRSPVAYGNKYRTQVVRFADGWRVAEAFVLPDGIVDRFEDMSNSGGSWGPDGLLYVTGHDAGEAYAVEPPAMGSVMRWVDTVTLETTGQGIAWDRSAAEPTLYGIIRGETDEQNMVTSHRVPLREQQQRAAR
jgi:hypothetical protein